MMCPPNLRLILLGIVLSLAGGGTLHAQSVLERTPNLHNGWIGDQVQFTFNHRMWRSEIAGERRLLASPTFLLGVPVQGTVLVAAQYASSSGVVEANEWEVFARWTPLDPGEIVPFGASLTVAWNTAAESGDGELSLLLPVANLQLLGVVRAFSSAYETTDSRLAFGAGLVAGVSESVAFAGDVVSLRNREPDEEVVWSGGLQLQIPRSPHTFSFQVTNAPSATLHGSSRGNDVVMWGFEFTTPLTFFGDGG